MRDAFAKELRQLADEDNRIVLLSGDIGNRMFDALKEKHPDRFFNCGAAEANMVSVAAAMAASGLKPIAYTIVPFLTTRVMEQIRVDLCYHNVPAVLVGVGGGLCYASLGATHHSCEDIAMMRALPNMTVICPGDAVEVRLALRAAVECKGPVYIRLGKKGEPVVHSTVPPFKIGKSIVLKEGRDACLLSTGNILPVTMEAAKKLNEAGISAEVHSFHTVKPLDQKTLSDVLNRFPLVATIEEHSILGGLGGSVAEWLADHPSTGRLLRIGTPDEFFHEAGEQEYARERLGLTPEAMSKKIRELFARLNGKSSSPRSASPRGRGKVRG